MPAPKFTAKGLDGKEYHLANFQGRKVLLNFWSTSCQPCRGEFEDLSAKADELRRLGVDMLAISVDGPDAEETVRRFASDLSLPFAVLLGNDHVIPTYSTVNRYLFNRRRDLGVPTSFLVNEAGMVVKVYVGTAKADTVLADAATMGGLAVPFPGLWVTRLPSRN
ncbi:MAG: TlpA family protein disulfide reductase [bacterium]|nr:TlpA family protein disulfide reductase [bacterium]